MRGSLIIFLIVITTGALAQNIEISGTIRDKSTNQALPFTHVTFLPDSVRRITDNNGVFTVTLPKGNKTIVISYVGYKTVRYNVHLVDRLSMDFSLNADVNELDEVVVSSTKFSKQDMLRSTRSSTNRLSRDDIGSIPVLGGEADVIKTLQLLPGTTRGVEGSSDLFVRGGAADQNLVLLDGATVYNTSHLFGFLSVFNPDVVSDVESINGAFPAQYGGRLSSILNVRTRMEMADRTHISAEVGLIGARLFIQQPLIKKKATLWFSARRTYIDQVAKAAGLSLPYFFYDLNGKILINPTKRDNIQISHFSGDDRLDYLRDRSDGSNTQTFGYHSGNTNQSFRWNHTYNGNWYHDVTVYRTFYQYNFHTQYGNNSLLALSKIQDLGGKIQFSNDSLSRYGALVFGVEGVHHVVSPNVVNTTGEISELLKTGSTSGRVAIETAAFVQYEIQPTARLRINAGIRGSAAIVTNKRYINPEPRIAMRYLVGERSSIKASYSRMVQYLHRVSSSAISSPADIWYPVTDSVKPQIADQVGIAFQRNFPELNAMLSVETYYKKMNQLVGYQEGTNLFFNTDFASSLIQGNGKAYGFEFLLRKQSGKFTGWINYTLSWAWRRYDSINNGEWFHARYDRRHNGAVVLQYEITKRWTASLIWEYISGSRFTPVIGQYAASSPSLTGVDLVPVYAPINSVRLSDAHRLDLGIKFKSKPGNFLQWQIFAGVYNVYNRANPVGILVVVDKATGKLVYQQPGLFGLLPFISYGIQF